MKLSKYKDPNEFLLAEYSKYAEGVAEGDPMVFDDWLAGSDLPEIVDARELVKAQERNLSNYTDPNQVYETGSESPRLSWRLFGLSQAATAEACLASCL